jgi:hypothetical protein
MSIRKSKKNRKHNSQKKKDKRKNNGKQIEQNVVTVAIDGSPDKK